SRAALPLAASPPVSPMPKPILIGSAARAGPLATPASSSAAIISGRNFGVWPEGHDLGMAFPPPEIFRTVTQARLSLRDNAAGAPRRLGDQLVLQPVEMAHARFRLGARAPLGLGDIDRRGDEHPAFAGMPGGLVGAVIGLDVRGEIRPGRVARAGEHRIPERA